MMNLENTARRTPRMRLWAAALAAALVLGAVGLSERAEAALSAAETQALQQINAQVNATRNLQGTFVQVGPHGERSQGQFYLAKPGKVRFEYAKPSSTVVVSNGRWVGISDTKARTTERYPLASTPLKLLLSDNLNLLRDVRILDVAVESDLITLVMEENSSDKIGKLTLMFDPRTYQLKQWVVTDAQGLDTSVALYDVAAGQQAKNTLFVIPEYDLERARAVNR
jgi:outer membrane lipoprotein-sorting protein